ncbi:MAG TPA: hypothetical protein VGB43_07930 [Flavobacterium sp.]
MKQIIKILPLLLVTTINAQGNFDCKKFLKQEIDLEMKNPNQFKEDFLNFKHCGLDSYDIEMLSSTSNFVSFLIDLTSETNNSKITYGMFLEKILAFKRTDEYEEVREAYIASRELENKIATIENWTEDKLKLQKFNLSADLINQVNVFIINNSGAKTYKEILSSFRDEEEIKTDEFEFKNYGDANLDDLLKEAEKANKPLLIYFNGYACVNSRKMENMLIGNNLINSIIDKFYLVCLYVDDKKPLPESKQFKSVFGKQIKTIGQKHSEFQVTKFGVNTQPYFAILNPKGEIIATENYTSDPATIRKFLAN